MKKKSLADYWACIFLIAGGLMFYFAAQEPQDYIATWYRRIAWAALLCFPIALAWSKWKLGEFFSNKSGGN
jgi:hypothetical protein